VILDEFRRQFETWWAGTDAREVARKNSQGALLELMTFYEKLDGADRIMADQVLGEWVTSDNDRKRFDALAMVDQFRIRSAVPQLRALESAIAKRSGHEAPYELAKVRRILERLLD
jgi:hypothetical protein